MIGSNQSVQTSHSSSLVWQAGKTAYSVHLVAPVRADQSQQLARLAGKTAYSVHWVAPGRIQKQWIARAWWALVGAATAGIAKQHSVCRGSVPLALFVRHASIVRALQATFFSPPCQTLHPHPPRHETNSGGYRPPLVLQTKHNSGPIS